MLSLTPKTSHLVIWLAVTLVLVGYFVWVFFRADDKRALLPGITTSGHHQIEQRCDVCHDSEPTDGLFTSSGVSNASCMNCHKQDLEMANDSHPVVKFKNPENAMLLTHIAATECVTCHTEHVEDRTHSMAVSVPPDYCAHCHQTTLENRPSHVGLDFETCATAGCHNYHDNQMLFESFLQEHAIEPAVLTKPEIEPLDPVYRWIAAAGNKTDAATAPDAPVSKISEHPETVGDWSATAHAAAGVNCTDCHGKGNEWIDRPAVSSCNECHSIEHEDFQKGKHGMRLAADLSPMEPSMARLPMKATAAHSQVDCISCHGEHRFDRQFAAAEACLTCHDDKHSLDYVGSPHHSLWEAEVAGDAPEGTGVSCATCHMPRETRRLEGGEITRVIQHNQNANLRPNEKMYRGVCMKCHGLPLTIDSLADPERIANNFTGPPEVHVESIDWVLEIEKKRQAREADSQSLGDASQ